MENIKVCELLGVNVGECFEVLGAECNPFRIIHTGHLQNSKNKNRDNILVGIINGQYQIRKSITMSIEEIKESLGITCELKVISD